MLIFFVENMIEAFALQKLVTFFGQKISGYFRSENIRNLNKMLPNDVSFEQPGPHMSISLV